MGTRSTLCKGAKRPRSTKERPGEAAPGSSDVQGVERRYTFFSKPTAGSPPKYVLPAKNDPDATFSMNRSVDDTPYRTTLFAGTVST